MAAIVTSVVSFVLGFLMYGLALDSFMRANSGLSPEIYSQVFKPMDQMNWLAMILSILTSGFLITIILMWGNITTAGGGAKAGAIIGVLMSASYDFGFLSYSNMHTMASASVDIIAGTVMCAIMGAVAGWMLGRGATAPATA